MSAIAAAPARRRSRRGRRCRRRSGHRGPARTGSSRRRESAAGPRPGDADRSCLRLNCGSLTSAAIADRESSAIEHLPSLVVLPSFTPQAVIVDIDGTIADSMHLHAEAFGLFAERHGLPALTTEDRARLDGRRHSDIFPLLFKRDVPREEWRQYEEEQEGLYRALSRGRLAPMRGLTQLVQTLKDAHIAVALATSAPQPHVTHTLGELGLAEVFPILVRGDQVARGTPAPEVLLEAARQLNVARRRRASCSRTLRWAWSRRRQQATSPCARKPTCACMHRSVPATGAPGGRAGPTAHNGPSVPCRPR